MCLVVQLISALFSFASYYVSGHSGTPSQPLQQIDVVMNACSQAAILTLGQALYACIEPILIFEVELEGVSQFGMLCVAVQWARLVADSR